MLLQVNYFSNILKIKKIIIHVFVVPLKFGFQLKFDDVTYNLLYRIPGILLFTDIIIKFNTGYYEEG